MSSWANYFYSTAQSLGNSVVNWLNSNNIELRVEYQEGGVRYRRVISGPNRHDEYVVERGNINEGNEMILADPNAAIIRLGGGTLGAAALIASGRAFSGDNNSVPGEFVMTDSMIDSTCIVTEYVLKDQPEQCPICMEDYRQGESIRVLPCFHKYHRLCIDEWLRPHGDCPVCKYSLIQR